MARKIIALHGFLGHPRDFKPLSLNGLIAPNIFCTPLCPLEPWARRFNSIVADQPILMGYSMGGRLALHCLLGDPKIFKAAIILAAHPGLNDQQLRRERSAYDGIWATEFLKTPWASLMREWDKAPALCSSKAIVRAETDFSRRALASSLRYFSLGRQQFLAPKINELSLPILWLSPENEAEKVASIKLSNPNSEMVQIRRGGHRFMFEDPQLVANLINRFLDRLDHSSSPRREYFSF